MRALHLPLLLLSTFTTLTHTFTPLSPASLQSIKPPTPEELDPVSGSLLSPILIPRVPGTPGSLKVLQHFQTFFTTHLPSWQLSTQNSSQITPLSRNKNDKTPFVNFIATRDPPWVKDGDVGRIVLTAHYDSKSTPEGFVGATDSAVPCAVLMWAAERVEKGLSRKWEAMAREGDVEKLKQERGVMILFLDGEEAFHTWTDTDSLYGARDLAEFWDTAPVPAMSTRRSLLSRIDLFVLLDLLGAPNPRIPSYFQTTHWAYMGFAQTFDTLRSLGLLRSADPPSLPNGMKKPSLSDSDSNTTSSDIPSLYDENHWFPDGAPEKNKIPESYDSSNVDFKTRPRWMSFIQDDHIPFLARGVEVLHLIPERFPEVWHRMEDDGEHLDLGVVKDWALVTAGWVGGVMELEGWMMGGEVKDAAMEVRESEGEDGGQGGGGDEKKVSKRKLERVKEDEDGKEEGESEEKVKVNHMVGENPESGNAKKKGILEDMIERFLKKSEKAFFGRIGRRDEL